MRYSTQRGADEVGRLTLTARARRVIKERRELERRLQAERNRHSAEVLTLQIEIVRLKSERGVLQMLTDRWFRARKDK